MNLQALQPSEKRQWLLCTSATTTASPEEPSTCDESFASNDSVANVNHNQPKPLCCGYMPDVPSPFVHNWAFAAHGLQPLPFTFEELGLRALVCEHFAQYAYASEYMQSVHLVQKLTEEEVLKYALRKEEYVGVLGKGICSKGSGEEAHHGPHQRIRGGGSPWTSPKDQEKRLTMDLTKGSGEHHGPHQRIRRGGSPWTSPKDQEMRLTMDLTKLKNDANISYQPSSFLEQSCFSAGEMVIYSLLSGFLVQICGYGSGLRVGWVQ